MSIRGTGSLQELLGRNLYAKKRKRPKDEATTNDQPDPPPVANSTQPPAAGDSPAKSGHSRCPVCSKQLSTSDLDAFNAHLDKCLSKNKPKKTVQQATLLRFRAPTAPQTATDINTLQAPPPAPQQQQQQQEVIDLTQCDDHSSPTWPSSSSSPSKHPQSANKPTPHTTPTKQQQQQQRPFSSSPIKSPHRRFPASPLSVPPPTCFACGIVGRQHRNKNDVCDLSIGQRLLIKPELNNPRDANALLVVHAVSAVPAGHLPRAVAAQLGPLLRKGSAAAEAIVTDIPQNEKTPVGIELQITSLPTAVTSPERVGAAVHRAREAAAKFTAGGHGNTGEHLRKNFLVLIDVVCNEDGGLLDNSECQFVENFKGLSASAQCLFLRLWQRRGPLFRIEALSYAEVEDVEAAVEELQGIQAASRLEFDPTLVNNNNNTTIIDLTEKEELCAEWEELADVLTVPELQAVLFELQTAAGHGFSTAANQNRAQVLASLGRIANQGGAERHTVLCDLLLTATGPLVRLNEAAVVATRRLQRLFFLNEGQTLGQFLATDLGGLRYPSYEVKRTKSVFASREHLLEYETALQHAAELTDALEEGDMEAAEAAISHAWAALDANRHKIQQQPTTTTSTEQQPLYLRRFNAAWIYCMMSTAGVSLLEKQKQYSLAVDRLWQLLGGWCCPRRRGEWWLRLSTDLEHMGRPTDALEVAESALADDWLSKGDRLGLQRKVLRLGKPPRRWKRPVWADEAQWEPPEVRIVGLPLANNTGVKSRFYSELNDEQCTVEELALQYYSTVEGGRWHGVHSEGGIWATLFGLLMWDVLFHPIDDVLRTQFQTAPLDLDTDAFFPARQIQIESHLSRIASGAEAMLSMLETSWNTHRGCMCRGVAWDRWELSELLIIAKCIGGSGLAAICRLLAEDHGGWSGGMPDLLLWHPERGVAKLSEVKGPRDRLSDQQRAWMTVLSDGGLAVEVLKVVEPTNGNGNNKGKKGGKKR